jgi:hypothetical protein
MICVAIAVKDHAGEHIAPFLKIGSGAAPMKIEIRLKQVFAEHNLDTHGLITRLASDVGEHRNTIRKLLDNQFSHPPLAVLGKVCEWLVKQGVSANELPQRLLGTQPSQLWHACAKSEQVTLYLGEYHQVDTRRPQFWVSQRDAAVASEIIRLLLESRATTKRTPVIREEYVSFHYTDISDQSKCNSTFPEDVEASRKKLARTQRNKSVSILIGSQRANYLVEHYVAELFGCRPFETVRTRIQTPIYLMHRPDDWIVPSCFGGLGKPPKMRLKGRPGLYIVGPDGEWNLIEWKEHMQDAGVVIVERDPGTESIKLVVFGFSGSATLAMREPLRWQADEFWPPTERGRNGREIGVYVVRLTFDGNPPAENDRSTRLIECKIEAIDGAVLEEMLSQ